MLNWLSIKNFVLIESLDLDFQPGLTTITGESGAGKSIIVDAIGLLIGDRADEGFIKHGQDSCDIQASFNLTANTAASEWLAKQDLLNDDNECLLRRVLRRQKPTRAYINGINVTIGQLREFGQHLVDIHGQHEHHSLLSKATQLNIVDAQAGNTDLLTQLNELYPQLKQLQSQIDKFTETQDQQQQRADLLQFHCDELTELAPQENEWPELEKKQKRISHQVEIAQITQGIFDSLDGQNDNTLCDNLERHIYSLDKLSSVDQSFAIIKQMLSEASINLKEAAQELRPYFQGDLLSETQVSEIEHRFARYHELARKHKVSPDELSRHFAELQTELDTIANPEKELQTLKQKLEETLTHYDKLSEKLTKSREKTAKVLSKQISQSMHELGMSGGKFEIRVIQNEQRFSRLGNETIEFYVSTNPGQIPQRLNKVASGGEISRISLALQVVATERVTLPTLIFDEVDVGISGKIADVVGQRLRRIGARSQVLCITHLPQVAVQGHQQFSVRKHTKDAASSEIIELNSEQRIEEIAHMNSGSNITDKALEHAREMLEQATS